VVVRLLLGERWGQYYVYDPANDTRSARFRINHDVYEDALKQAVRVYFYQRRGAAKSLPWAETHWTDGTNFMDHCKTPIAGR
jgi:hypothetical protein